MHNLQEGIDYFQSSNYKEAFDLLYPLAEEGNSEAQCIVANMFQFGLGIERDMLSAIKWYEMAQEQEHIIAMNNLANIFQFGDIDVPKNINRALNLYKKASKFGFAPAQYYLGKLLLGEETILNIKLEAYKWIKLSAEQGFQPALDELKYNLNQLNN